MVSMDICSLLGLAPSGFSMYCSFLHFQVGFIFQIRMLPLGKNKQTKNTVKPKIIQTPDIALLLIFFLLVGAGHSFIYVSEDSKIK